MKAVRINQWGQPVRIENISQPAPAKDEVLVRVQAAGLNPVDSYSIAGYMKSMQQLPFIPGTDFAGEAIAVGSEIKHIKPGDAVYGMIPFRGGTFAEYAAPKGNEVAQKPQSIDFIQAAAVPLAALAAWQTLIDSAQVLNAQTQHFENEVGKVDIVLNYASLDLLERSYSVLKPGGRYATTLPQPPKEQAESLGIRSTGIIAQPTVDQLNQITRLIDAGKLKPFVDRTFPLNEARAALEYRQNQATVGKVVLTL